jgi:diguanylate cyclase (GGDEF)-like protein
MQSAQTPAADADREVRILLLAEAGVDCGWLHERLGRSTTTRFSVLAGVEMEAVGDDAVDLVLVMHTAAGSDALSQTLGRLARQHDVPVVVISESDDERLAQDVFEAGAEGFLARSEAGTRLLVTTVLSAIRGHRSIRELSGARERERMLATHDQLTSLANRYLFHDRLGQALAASRRNGQRMAILFIDLDNFKLVNDTLGHAVGDHLLLAIARHLTTALRESDTAARMGGDEFALLLTNLTHELDAARIAEKILDALARPLLLNDRTIHCTASIGIATVPANGDDPKELIRRADTAMYQAKKNGRNRFEFFTDQMNQVAQRRLSIESELGTALANRALEVHYQPFYDLRRGRVIGGEALLRWTHPKLGRVVPDEFLPMAEESGEITAIGEWVLMEACRQAVAWQRGGYEGFRIAVNVSPRQLQQPNFRDQVEKALMTSGLQPESLELEITESSVVRNVDGTLRALHHLKSLGVHLAVDDFGTGYSALAYLKDLPIDLLKIDRSFVASLLGDPANVTIVEAVIRMARGLNLTTVAEGVEDHDQLLLLGSLGCNRMQGFLFGRPTDADTFTQFLANPTFRLERERVDDGDS